MMMLKKLLISLLLILQAQKVVKYTGLGNNFLFIN
jgi:hypothetical protein